MAKVSSTCVSQDLKAQRTDLRDVIGPVLLPMKQIYDSAQPALLKPTQLF